MEPEIRLFDSHLHLQDRRLDGSLEEVIEEARAAGVQHFACNGCCEDDWSKVKSLSSKYPEVVPNYGLHPWFIEGRSGQWLSKLREFLEEQPQAGLGECGLDRSKRAPNDDLEEQAGVMTQQVELAKELGRPVSVHCVQAFGKLQEVLQQYGPFPDGFILHSWAGNAEQVKQFRRIKGVYFSISGHTLNASPKKLEPMLREIPDERLLLETDAPDGLPKREGAQTLGIGTASQLNHPVNIRFVLENFAKATGREPAACARVAYRNAISLFLK